MSSRKSLMVHYRRLEDATGAFNGQTLEAAVRGAMQHPVDGGPLADHWKRRAWLIPPGDEDTLLSNVHYDGGDHYFGDLTLYSRGYMQALLREQDDAPILDIEQQPAPAGQEYVHSMMYWLIRNNHALVIQSQSLTSKSLENYLTWLLKERTPIIGDTGQVLLESKFDAAEVGGDLEDIREIVVGGTSTRLTASATPPLQTRETTGYQAVADATRTGVDKAREVLLAVMNSESDVMELIASIPEEASLQVSVHIGYKTHKRAVSRAPMQQALRNLPDGEITAIGKSGKLIGNDIRLTHPVSVLRQGSLLDPEDVKRALNQAYTYFVENGKIDP